MVSSSLDSCIIAISKCVSILTHCQRQKKNGAFLSRLNISQSKCSFVFLRVVIFPPVSPVRSHKYTVCTIISEYCHLYAYFPTPSCINLNVYWIEAYQVMSMCNERGSGLRRSTPSIKVSIIIRQLLCLMQNRPKKRFH